MQYRVSKDVFNIGTGEYDGAGKMSGLRKLYNGHNFMFKRIIHLFKDRPSISLYRINGTLSFSKYHDVLPSLVVFIPSIQKR